MYMHISFYMTVCRADHGIKGTKTYVYGMRFYSFTTKTDIANISKACKLDIKKPRTRFNRLSIFSQIL